jgi:hypothetical protein
MGTFLRTIARSSLLRDKIGKGKQIKGNNYLWAGRMCVGGGRGFRINLRPHLSLQCEDPPPPPPVTNGAATQRQSTE